MPVTSEKKGFSTLIAACRHLCRAFGLFYPAVRPELPENWRAALDVLQAACTAFITIVDAS